MPALQLQGCTTTRASFETAQAGLLRMTRFWGCTKFSHGEERGFARLEPRTLAQQSLAESAQSFGKPGMPASGPAMDFMASA
jgi:hypothetical protein